jgi:hypothetical protein
MRSISLLSKRFLGILLIASAAISCKEEDSPTPEKSTTTPVNTSGFGNISYFAKASGAGIKTSAMPDSNTLNPVAVNWSSASVYVEKISFTGKTSNLLDTTITVEKNLNIFSANALAGVIKLPAGSYKDVKVKMYCKKSAKSELAFNLKGTFTNTKGGIDSVMVASSYPFEANLAVTDILINTSDKYKATFYFDLNKTFTGISNALLETANSFTRPDNKKVYVIWKGGSAEEPFYNQVIQNWQTVASVVVAKEEE